MINFGIITLTFLVFVYQNIILINEETLILLCFVAFCWLAFNRLKNAVYSNLTETSKKIETSVIVSMDQLSRLLTYSVESQRILKSVVSDLESLGNHFHVLNSTLLSNLPHRLVKKSSETYPKKLLFVQRLEQRTAKLLPLIVSRKLAKVAFINKFFAHKVKISAFTCKHNISVREYINTI
uniref:Hypothetical mitochondrionreading frame n=1 Tax=Gloiopeltis furcata TaxID=42017 RepID=A0A5A4SCW9_9FLOR|nr:hypothetical mitochondrionreading frame [Gloiopeltis furcata]BBK20776.1 hypothetical mitochondrionreading frame [Gloiopeltis furcata]